VSSSAAATDHGIVPDVLSAFHPALDVNVAYGEHKANYGNELTPRQVKNKPTVTYNGNPDKYYTLILTDPDAPSRKDPKWGQWWHWLVVNVKGSNVSSGEEVIQYIGSAPPPDTGLHRYVFIVAEQEGHVKAADFPHFINTQAKGREKNNAEELFKKHNLKPVGLNLYQAKWDDYVPEVYASLTS